MLHSSWALVPLLLATACGLPADPGNTSERIASTHELRVGITDNDPWVNSLASEPTGIEPALVREFAGQLGAKVVWSRGSEAQLAKRLEQHQLDIAIGGFHAETPWKSRVGVSRPFETPADREKHVFLAVPGENRFILRLDTFLADPKHRVPGTGA